MIYNKHLKKIFQTENYILHKRGDTFTSTKNHYSHIPPIPKFSPTKNRSYLFQMENLYPVTYKPNISIYKERNNYYQNKKEILQMITQETKTFIQCETEYYFYENGLYMLHMAS